MIKVQVKLYATLRRYQPHTRLGEGDSISLPEGATIGQLMVELGIPADAVKTVFVKGEMVKDNYVLHTGDDVGIFPPIAGG
jgi:molybdopterin synthase sulfur carrier subunit